MCVCFKFTCVRVATQTQTASEHTKLNCPRWKTRSVWRDPKPISQHRLLCSLEKGLHWLKKWTPCNCPASLLGRSGEVVFCSPISDVLFLNETAKERTKQKPRRHTCYSCAVLVHQSFKLDLLVESACITVLLLLNYVTIIKIKWNIKHR